MSLASFVRNGSIDCGLVDEGGYRVFDSHPFLRAVPAPRRLNAILEMESGRRAELLRGLSDLPLVPGDRVALLPAVPCCPLYIYNHANNPTVWKRQDVARQWEMTRLPYLRVRSRTSFAAHGSEFRVPAGSGMSCGVEFGVVIGRPARNVSRADAFRHIAGIVALNDSCTRDLIDEFGETEGTPAAANQKHGIDTLRKNTDVSAGVGPWITLVETLEAGMAGRFDAAVMARYRDKGLAPWLYDKTLFTWVNGRLLDEAWSGAYLYGAEWMIGFLSQSMCLPTGSIIGLGAAGWDGIGCTLGEEPGSRTPCGFEISGHGKLVQTAVRVRAGDGAPGPYAESRKRAGLKPVPSAEEGEARAFWALRGNYPEASQAEGLAAGRKMNPILFPPGALSFAAGPVELPPHAREVRVSLHLAGVIGPEPVYGFAGDVFARALASLHFMLQIRDCSLYDDLATPTAYEARACWFLGACGDRMFRAGPGIAPGEIPDWTALRGSLRMGSRPESIWRTSNYLNGFAGMLTLVSRAITLLPGDVVSLGAMGAETVIPMGEAVGSIAFSGPWGPPVELAVTDRRDAAVRRIPCLPPVLKRA